LFKIKENVLMQGAMTHPSDPINRSTAMRRAVQTIRRHDMLAAGDKVLVAVSGGADSTALLHILQALAPKFGIELAVAHLNHGLRGRAADDEARFVRAMTERQGLTFHGGQVHLDPRQGSLEERGRRERYAFLRKLARQHGYTKIALGHHMDDNAEALLMHLLRGSGIRGLGGIPPKRGAGIIRPLIDLRHGELVTFLENHHIAYVQDASNTDLRFYRNRIRHRLIPLLQADYSTQVVATLHRTADLCREEEAWLQAHLAPLLDETITRLDPQQCLEMRVDSLAGAPLAVQRHLIRDGLRRWQGSLRRISAAHIDRVIGLLPPEAEGKQLCLPNRIGAVRGPEGLRFVLRQGRGGVSSGHPADFAYEIPRQPDTPYILDIPEAGLRLRFSLHENRRQAVVNPGEADCAWFDADRLTFPLTIRNFIPGDRMIPWGLQGHQKVKKIFSDRKIPPLQRGRIPLLVSAGTIVWVVGVRRGASAAVGRSTRCALQVRTIKTEAS
jgi:tRNA(Ile)-lysidine synthase